jgi:transcriptional antiterminator NusG
MQRQVFEIGQMVEVLEGPFVSFRGHIEEVHEDKKKLLISINIFEQPTKILLGLDAVKSA